METDWSVAAGADDPLIEADWRDPAGANGWLDLRVHPELQAKRIAMLPEVQRTPELAPCLALLNARSGLLLTTKCDVWPLDASELADTADLLDVPTPEFGMGSYVDVLLAPPDAIADFLLHEEWARTTSRRCAATAIADARVELVVRPARSGETWGFGLTIYCYGIGSSTDQAHAAWAEALQATVPTLLAVSEELLPVVNPGEPRELQ